MSDILLLIFGAAAIILSVGSLIYQARQNRRFK